MILPTKHIYEERALLTVGARLLTRLSTPKTVSTLWEEVRQCTASEYDMVPTLRYDAYLLTLDLLNLMGAIELEAGLLCRSNS